MPTTLSLSAETRDLTKAEKSAEEAGNVVQYNVHIGNKIGTLVKDSVVQRSTIGASARKCPNCGREVEANEKFCLECGAKL